MKAMGALDSNLILRHRVRIWAMSEVEIICARLADLGVAPLCYPILADYLAQLA